MRSLEESEAIVGCSICKALANELRKRAKLHVAKDEHMGVEAQIHRLEDRDSLAIRRVSGSLAESSRMYQLDFVHQKTNTILRTFALTPTSKSVPKLHFWGLYALLLHIQGSRRACLLLPSFHCPYYEYMKPLRTQILLITFCISRVEPSFSQNRAFTLHFFIVLDATSFLESLRSFLI
jgi:hypothetical protein